MQKNTTNSSDKDRKYVRLEVVAKVNFRIKGEETMNTTEKVSAIAKNINVEGICLRTDQNIKKGSVLELEIFVTEEPRPLYMEGEVRWIKPVLSASNKTVYDIGVKLYTFQQCEVARFVSYVCETMMHRLNRHRK